MEKKFKYSDEYLKQLSSKYNNRRDLELEHPGIADIIRRRGLTHFFDHMTWICSPPRQYDDVKKIALNYESIKKFKEEQPKLYGWVQRDYQNRNSILSHMVPLRRSKITQSEIDEALNKCTALTQLKSDFRRVYEYLVRREDYKEVTKHLRRHPRKEKKPKPKKPTYSCKYCTSETKCERKVCGTCRNIERRPLVIKELTKDNVHEYKIGDINKFILTNYSKDQWVTKIKEVLNFKNPHIEYHLEDYNMKTKTKIRYNCRIHPEVTGATNLDSIFSRNIKNCRTCSRGQRQGGYWNIDTIKSELKEALTKYYDETNIIPFFRVVDSELIPGIGTVIHRLFGSATQFYLNFLQENNFPPPDEGLFKDGVLFRGHYEYVGYCFVKAWGINVIPVKKMDKYYSDGYFVDIDTYWEHWGDLNKNNKTKKKLYKKNKLNLFETYDKECAKHGKGYEYLYNTMRDFFVSKGYDIPEYNRNDLYALLKKEIVTFENTLEWIVGILKAEPTFHKHLTTKKLCQFDFGHRIVFFFGRHFNGITNFKEYLNENYGFNYPLQKHVNKTYYLSEENLFRELTPIVKQYGRLPSRLELEACKRRDIDRFIKRHFGGFKDMRRNEIYVGKYFHIIDNMLDGKAPWDLKIDWDTDVDDTIHRIIKYWKEERGVGLPYYFSDLRDCEPYGNLGKQLYNIITKSAKSKIDVVNWTDFKRKYEGYDGPEIPERPFVKIHLEVGTVFGNWTILEERGFRYFNSEKENRVRNFLCRCVCGTEKESTINNILRKGSHCGCMLREKIDYEKKYGMLTILSEIDNTKGKNRIVVTKCDCGITKNIQYTFIRNNIVTNCGCIKSIHRQVIDHFKDKEI